MDTSVAQYQGRSIKYALDEFGAPEYCEIWGVSQGNG